MKKFLGLAVVVALLSTPAEAGLFKRGKKARAGSCGGSVTQAYHTATYAQSCGPVQMTPAAYYPPPQPQYQQPVPYQTPQPQPVTPSPQSGTPPVPDKMQPF